MNHISQLEQMIQKSVSPYHCILESSRQLKEAGFSQLNLGEHWDLKKGGRYFLPVFDSSLIAFHIGEEVTTDPAFYLSCSHTDWPCLKLKPCPEVSGHHYGKLNVEVYGGPIFSTWFDRPLSMAGKVSLMGEDPLVPKTVFVDFKRPVLTIPNLAIHMNREVNQGASINPQLHMLPLFTLLKDQLEKDHFFLSALAKELQVNAEDILDYEIYVYNAEPSVRVGQQEEFLSAPRLDNLTSVQACVTGIIHSHPKKDIHISCLYDNEEVGNTTKQGAASDLTQRILEKILLSLGLDREAFINALFNGFLLSLDAAHAIHPNYPEKCDITNQITAGDGVVLKLSASQSYATDASCCGVIESLCRFHKIPYKKFSNRSDLRGGQTLGSITSCNLSMRAADAGVPMLSMHSARELMAVKDQDALVNLTIAFFNGLS